MHLKDAHSYCLDEEARANEDGCRYHRLVASIRARESQETAN